MSKIEKELSKINNSICLYVVSEVNKTLKQGDGTDESAMQTINSSLPNATCINVRPIKVKLNDSGAVAVFNGTRFVMNG